MKGQRVRVFKWIEWNLQKIDNHGLSPEDVESAFDRVLQIQRRRDGSFQVDPAAPNGRRIWVIWRFDREEPGQFDFLTEIADPPIFVITAY